MSVSLLFRLPFPEMGAGKQAKLAISGRLFGESGGISLNLMTCSHDLNQRARSQAEALIKIASHGPLKRKATFRWGAGGCTLTSHPPASFRLMVGSNPGAGKFLSSAHFRLLPALSIKLYWKESTRICFTPFRGLLCTRQGQR